METTTATFKRFNRHEVFSAEDRRTVLDATFSADFDLENKLFGLFDGYLYSDLLELAEDQLPTEDLEKVEKLVAKINAA